MTDTTKDYTHWKGIDAEHICIGGVEVDIAAFGIVNLVPTVTQMNAWYAAYLAQLTNPLVIRTNVLAAAVTAGTAVVCPAVAGQRFQVLNLAMRCNGGNLSGPTTIEIVEQTAGTVFLSHVTADMLSGVWNSLIGGTAVITGMTAGGMTSAANKGLLLTDTGGTAFATATSADVIVCGYYTTT